LDRLADEIDITAIVKTTRIARLLAGLTVTSAQLRTIKYFSAYHIEPKEHAEENEEE